MRTVKEYVLACKSKIRKKVRANGIIGAVIGIIISINPFNPLAEVAISYDPVINTEAVFVREESMDYASRSEAILEVLTQNLKEKEEKEIVSETEPEITSPEVTEPVVTTEVTTEIVTAEEKNTKRKTVRTVMPQKTMEVSSDGEAKTAYVWSTGGDFTSYYYRKKQGTLRGGSGRTLIPGYSVGCSIDYHKELYGKIITIAGVDDIDPNRHFRVDDCGHFGKGSLDYYAGTGDEYKSVMTQNMINKGRYRGITITIIGEWDAASQTEIIY
ncbi:MAG: hypothetical protein LBL93_06640 [Ruminococcus sp.]|jgi:hypothetical protein|nr:hypothetical protein [Ruminococcus sp.]